MISFREKIVLLLLLGTIFVLGCVRLVLLHELDTKDGAYANVLNHIETVRAKNMQLQTAILEQSSLTTLSQEASAAGYIPQRLYVLW